MGIIRPTGHRAASPEPHPIPRPTVHIRRAATKTTKAKAAEPPKPPPMPKAKPKPKPKPAKVWGADDTRDQLAAEALRRGLKVTTRTTKNALIEMLKG